MQQRQKDITAHRDANAGKQFSVPEDVIREQTRALTMLERDYLHETQMANRFGHANRTTGVFFIACGSGVHNTDFRRTAGYQNYIPAALLDPSVSNLMNEGLE